MQLKSLLFICMIAFASYANAQYDDETPGVPEPQWRWKFYPVTAVIQKEGKQIVEVTLDRYENYKFLYQLKKSGYKTSSYNETKTTPIQPGKSDTLEIISPYKKGEKQFTDIYLPIITQNFTDDGKGYNMMMQFQLPARSSTVEKGDIVSFEIDKKFYNDSLLFYKLEDMRFSLLGIDEKELFENRQYWGTPVSEMAAAKNIKDELHYAGDVFMDKLKDPLVQKGPYAGKTLPQILKAATEKEIIQFVNYIVSQPRELMGKQFKVAEVYGQWVALEQPKGGYGPLKVELEYNKWIKMEPIEIDLDAGTINKKPIQKIVNPYISGLSEDWATNSQQQLIKQGKTLHKEKKNLC